MASPHDGFSATDLRQTAAGCTTAVPRPETVLCPAGYSRRGFVSRRGTGVWRPTLQHGGAGSHHPQNAERSDVLENRFTIFERFNSRWTPTTSSPRTVARAAVRHLSPSSGPAYGVRKTAGLARTPERLAVLGTARASGPFWTTHTTMTHALNRPKSFGNQDSATNDPSGSSCRLPPAPEGVGIRLESL